MKDRVKHAADGANSTVKYLVEGSKSGAKRAYKAFIQVVVTYAVFAVLLFVAAFGILEVLGIETGVPTELSGYLVYLSYGILVALIPAELLRQYIASREFERLHLVDPENGDAAFRELPPALWGALTVKSVYRDEDTGQLVEVERDKDHLHRISVETEAGARTGWEGEYYDDATNTVYVSYYGGVSGTEIRREMKEGVEFLKLETAVEREWHERLRRNFSDILEQAVATRVNYVIALIEGERVPGSESTREFIDRKTQDAEVDDILEFGKHPAEEVEQDNPFKSERVSEMVQNPGENHE